MENIEKCPHRKIIENDNHFCVCGRVEIEFGIINYTVIKSFCGVCKNEDGIFYQGLGETISDVFINSDSKLKQYFDNIVENLPKYKSVINVLKLIFLNKFLYSGLGLSEYTKKKIQESNIQDLINLCNMSDGDIYNLLESILKRMLLSGSSFAHIKSAIETLKFKPEYINKFIDNNRNDLSEDTILNLKKSLDHAYLMLSNKNKDSNFKPYEDIKLIDKVKGINGAFQRVVQQSKQSGVNSIFADAVEIQERQVCCSLCTKGNSCPYCGCQIKKTWFFPLGKSELTTEGCPNKNTYPHLKKYPEHNYWIVCGKETAVIVPYFKTDYEKESIIQAIHNNATGKIKIINCDNNVDVKNTYEKCELEYKLIAFSLKDVETFGFDTMYKYKSLSAGQKFPEDEFENYSAILSDDITSVIICSRNEKHLNKTIRNILDNATGKIEILAVLDGYHDEVLQDDRVKVIHNKEPIGKRKSINYASSVAIGKYLFIIDAHCTISKGWDTKLKYVCKPNNVVISTIFPLDENLNRSKSGGVYQVVGLNKDLQEKWDSAITFKNVEKTWSFTGCGWMIEKDFLNKIGKFDESFGEWGFEGPEITLKVYCGENGNIIIRKDVECGHLFGTNKNSQLYKSKNVPMSFFKDRMYNLYGEKIEKMFKDNPKWDFDIRT